MRRREFIAGLAGAAAWPLTARAQQPAVPVIGFLSSVAESEAAKPTAAFRQGLGEQGYVAGRNVEILYRFAGTRYDRLPALAADLVSRRASVIVRLVAALLHWPQNRRLRQFRSYLQAVAIRLRIDWSRARTVRAATSRACITLLKG
jgi:hypothetical protein